MKKGILQGKARWWLLLLCALVCINPSVHIPSRPARNLSPPLHVHETLQHHSTGDKRSLRSGFWSTRRENSMTEPKGGSVTTTLWKIGSAASRKGRSRLLCWYMCDEALTTAVGDKWPKGLRLICLGGAGSVKRTDMSTPGALQSSTRPWAVHFTPWCMCVTNLCLIPFPPFCCHGLWQRFFHLWPNTSRVIRSLPYPPPPSTTALKRLLPSPLRLPLPSPFFRTPRVFPIWNEDRGADSMRIQNRLGHERQSRVENACCTCRMGATPVAANLCWSTDPDSRCLCSRRRLVRTTFLPFLQFLHAFRSI